MTAGQLALFEGTAPANNAAPPSPTLLALREHAWGSPLHGGIRSLAWRSLLTDRMLRHVSHYLDAIFGYTPGDALWQLDVVSLGRVPLVYSCKPPRLEGHYMVAGCEGTSRGRYYAYLSVTVIADLLSPAAARRAAAAVAGGRAGAVRLSREAWLTARGRFGDAARVA